ncbi:50S ribosomal protein L11 methyltransferase [Campylobacter sp. FMV-PI01]|uniref:Ribosomal protein L11 methyltransferase n=1 Tax=Campylobacter portucalensis TaxID=2608384 RepID=A0A6L5WF36_9BACT|nr:50S ribosomal protein L11 methyltransferase [Campylobacter portucalensis]MSN95598.1 50S ribosomal protein L11 methyltransferase [Campylobacter portucalensis]
MDDIYFELKVSSKNALEFFREFAFEIGVSAVEMGDGFFIVRDGEDLKNLEFALIEYKNALQKTLNLDIDLNLHSETKKNIDWIDEYKKGVKPINVGDLYIHPSWQEKKDGFLNIIIDPGLAFGSGHHESTNMCLELIQKHKKGCKTALDVGCGSGILSISMAKFGLNVSACDTDEIAISSTKQNALKNDVNLDEIWVGSIAKLEKKYDLVVANLIADIIFMLKKELINSLNLGGILILSGILDKYLDRIKSEFKDLTLLEVMQQNEWVSVVFKRKD